MRLLLILPRFVLSLIILSGVVLPAQAIPPQLKAPHAILIDGNTGTVLFERSADERMYPASMTKVLTAYMVFRELKEGRLKLDDYLTVSEQAWRQGGSRTFLNLGERVTVDSLIKGMIVQSGNDASVVLAEAIAGSEQAFAAKATDYARKHLGMTQTTFYNVTGWPHPEHKTTVHDLAVLATHIINDFPEYYSYYSIKEFTHNGIRQFARNPLLQMNFPGADGLKTGYTNDAGYGLIGSAKRGDLRLIAVVGGLRTPKDRATDIREILEWGFREYRSYVLFPPDKTVAEAQTWLGVQPKVAVATKEPIRITMPASETDKVKITVTYNEPLTAPLPAGTQVGMVRVENVGADNRTLEQPLYTRTAVDAVGMAEGIRRKLDFLLFGPGAVQTAQAATSTATP